MRTPGPAKTGDTSPGSGRARIPFATTWFREQQVLMVEHRLEPVAGIVEGVTLSVESQGQGLEVGALRQCRMDRVIGIGAGDPQDAAGAAGIGEAAAHRLGELRRADMKRAGS